MTMRVCRLLLSLCTVTMAAAQDAPETWTRPGPNVALGASYTLSPAPSYALCKDDGDATQLTDGEYTTGYFWTTATTVGWGAAHEPVITLDLGTPQPIAGVSYHTAAGRAGVLWPRSLALFVSNDGQQWHGVGDLVSLDRQRGGEPPEEYATYRFWTAAMQTHGRYLALAIQPDQAYTFVDEIEVYGGDPAWLDEPLAGPVMQGLEAAKIRRKAIADVEAQVDLLRERLKVVPAAQQAALRQALDEAQAGLTDLVPPAGARAEAPFGAAHQAVLDVNAAIGRALGSPPFVVWQTNKWDPLQMLDEPPVSPEPPRLAFAMMQHEVRAETLNLTNLSDHPLQLNIRVEGLPAASYVVRQALWTAVRGAPPMASALVDLSGPLTLESGLNRQLWLQLDSASLPAGDLTGSLRIDGAPNGAVSVPISVHVSRLAMPQQRSLALGGWDYTNGPHRGVTAENIDQVAGFLQSYGVDAPWATSSALPFGQHDATGTMTAPPPTTNLDAWLERWPGARYYCVFVATSENIAQQPGGERKVADWIRFWTGHLTERGVDPGKLVLLLVDETRSVEQDAIIVAWAKAIRAAAPEVKIFNDPIWQDPREATLAMYEASYFLCPNRVRWLEQPEAYEAVFPGQREAGRTLMFYSCSGPVRRLDPYRYHLLQAWEAFRVGAVASMFWSFGDSGGGTAWNEYVTAGNVYSPQMLGPDGATPAKHMEAIREGQQDYEYLVMLRDAVTAAAGRQDAAAKDARALLATVTALVLGTPDGDSIWWQRPADRGGSERARAIILAALERLAE